MIYSSSSTENTMQLSTVNCIFANHYPVKTEIWKKLHQLKHTYCDIEASDISTINLFLTKIPISHLPTDDNNNINNKKSTISEAVTNEEKSLENQTYKFC